MQSILLYALTAFIAYECAGGLTQIKDDSSDKSEIFSRRSMMIAEILIAASMCLQGGEQVDVSQYVSTAARVLELKVTLRPASGTLVIYSPGYEDQQAKFTQELSFGWIPFAEPILCIRSIGGPFEFNIDVNPIEDAD